MCTRFQIFIRLSTMYSTILITDHGSKMFSFILQPCPLNSYTVLCSKVVSSILLQYYISTVLCPELSVYQSSILSFSKIDDSSFHLSTIIFCIPQKFILIHNSFHLSTIIFCITQKFLLFLNSFHFPPYFHLFHMIVYITPQYILLIDQNTVH